MISVEASPAGRSFGQQHGSVKQLYRAIVPERVRFLIYEARGLATQQEDIQLNLDGLRPTFRVHGYIEKGICLPSNGEGEALRILLDNIEPGSHFLDIGASFGWYSIFAGLKRAEVDAVEPHPETVGHLRENIELNGLAGHVNVHQVAIALPREDVLFGMVRMKNDTERTPTMRDKARGKGFWALTAGVDTLVEQGIIRVPEVIKIDVEGAEMGVLLSAWHTLNSYGPKILLEIHHNYLPDFGLTGEGVKDLLDRMGYHIAKSWNRGEQELVWAEPG